MGKYGWIDASFLLFMASIDELSESKDKIRRKYDKAIKETLHLFEDTL